MQHQDMGRAWTTRFVVMIMFFFGIIISSHYIAALTAVFTLRSYTTPVTSIDDIRSRGIPFGTRKSLFLGPMFFFL